MHRAFLLVSFAFVAQHVPLAGQGSLADAGLPAVLGLVQEASALFGLLCLVELLVAAPVVLFAPQTMSAPQATAARVVLEFELAPQDGPSRAEALWLQLVRRVLLGRPIITAAAERGSGLALGVPLWFVPLGKHAGLLG